MKAVFTVLVLLMTAGSAHADRAQTYNQAFLGSAHPSNFLETEIRSVRGVRQLRTVLPGVLYRGGGPGGQRPLPDESLHSLCESGFSLAVYGYTQGFRDPGPVHCTNKITGASNTLEYIAGNANDAGFKIKFLNRVRAVANDPGRGPVFVHCWNGYHASGELAAVALRQFCGYSGERASVYWLRHSGGFPIISRIARFTPLSGLSISNADQVCR